VELISAASRAVGETLNYRTDTDLEVQRIVVSTASSTETSTTEDNLEEESLLPKQFETLDAPIAFRSRSRAFFMSLPKAGLTQVADVIASAIDRNIPVTGIEFDVIPDSEGYEELGAKVRVSLSTQDALELWEELGNQLHTARQGLPEKERARMEEEFGLFLRWNDRD